LFEPEGLVSLLDLGAARDRAIEMMTSEPRHEPCGGGDGYTTHDLRALYYIDRWPGARRTSRKHGGDVFEVNLRLLYLGALSKAFGIMVLLVSAFAGICRSAR
jgi:hypothetical protein